ncbi:MAG: SAM-dependent methyltransferase, partial [Anaerolineae bacterium]
PEQHFLWVRCAEAHTAQLKEWTLSGLQGSPGSALSVFKRELSEGLSTGLSRPPASRATNGPTLGDFAEVLRGIATGANKFFHLTARQADYLQIPSDFLRLEVISKLP